MSYVSRRRKPADPVIPRPRQDDGWDWLDDMGGPSQITVHEDEDEPQPTGLLDLYGNDICRVRGRHPMGFRLK